jgi:hypothetical protein
MTAWLWARGRRIFPAQFAAVTDGDTFWFLVDTGLHQRAEWPFRLMGYDAFEEDEPLGPAAALFAVMWFAEHSRHGGGRWPFLLFTQRQSKTSDYERKTLGRFVAEVECEAGHSYGPMLFAAGLVKA